jgi:beta-phosphoglucomutase-like phosphatase (HAD superfamily)
LYRALLFDLDGTLDRLAPPAYLVKPDPAPYRATLEKLGVASGEALAFEDSTSGIASTQAPETLAEAGTFLVAEDFAGPDLIKLLAS